MIKKISSLLWLLLIIGALSILFKHPEFADPMEIARFFKRFEAQAFLLYLLVSMLRGFTLIPSTPLILAGTLLFESQPLVLIISMLGIIFSSSMIYFFSDYLGFSQYFYKKEQSIDRIKIHLNSPYGFLFIVLWSFLPMTPTDAVCYVAGTTKMQYKKFITAVIVGESLICTIYIFGIRGVSELFFR